MPVGLDVRPYAAGELYDALSNGRFSPTAAEQHFQARYLNDYLTAIGARTMVVEPHYIDGDYLADFTSFYASCFEPYERVCRRLHFFASQFNDEHLEKIVFGKADSTALGELKDSYLGFVVVRPLPLAVVGRTLLAHYPSDGGRRHYNAVMKHATTLFGLRLQVTSLAFQEQDTAVAACATVSMWSALQKTADLFGTRAPRPPEITRLATQSLLYQRAIPSSGLRLEQMLYAIREAGLDPELYEPVSGNVFRPIASLIYAYSKASLPIILVGELLGIGGHAITIAGYSLRTTRVVDRELPTAMDQSGAAGS